MSGNNHFYGNYVSTGRRNVTVCFESREDGGLRAWSPDVPGFVLSGRDRAAVLADVKPALTRILGFQGH